MALKQVLEIYELKISHGRAIFLRSLADMCP